MSQVDRAAELEDEMATLRNALRWVGEVYPGKTRDGGAIVHMTWEEWGNLRAALGFRAQPIPSRATNTVRIIRRQQ